MPTSHKVGLGLAFILGLADIGFNFIPARDGLTPPPLVAGLGWVTGLATLVAVVWYWLRPAAVAKWVIVVSRLVSALAGVSALVTGAPFSIQVLVAVKVVLTCVALLLLI